MIPVCFPIQEDELYQGWLRDLARANSMKYKDFSKYFMGQRSESSLHYGFNLDNVVRQYHGVNHFFPDMYDIIANHTYYTVDKIGMSVGMAAITAETMLREQRTRSPSRKQKPYNLCPICAKEDKKKYNRTIIHVPHQINGVCVCYKHECAFEGESIENIEVEVQIAKFAYDLFKLTPDVTYEDVAIFVTDENVNEAVKSGYLNKEEGKKLQNSNRNRKYQTVDGIIRYLSWIFSGDAKKMLESIAKSSKELNNNDLFIRNDSRWGIGNYTCKTCGKSFYMSDRSVSAGEVCPLCSNRLPKSEQLVRILSRYRDGKYEYKDGKLMHSTCGACVNARSMFWLYDNEECRNCRINDLTLLKSSFEGTDYEFVRLATKGTREKPRQFIVKHIPCGTEIELSYRIGRRFAINQNAIKCPKCDGIVRADTKRLRAVRIGDRRVGTTGMGCEVVRYDGSYDVTVRFDNGLTKKMAWDHFKQIGTVKQTALPELYIGLERELDDGRTCKIVEYYGSRRILVEFSDGEKRWTTYKSFTKSQFKQSPRDRHAYEGKIVQLYKGTIVNVFESITDAAKQLGVTPNSVKNYINGITKSNEYEFKLVKSDRENENNDSYEITKNPEHLNIKTQTAKCNSRPVNQYDLDGHYMKTYESVSAAKRAIGVNPSTSLNSNAKIKTAGGFQWLYDTGNHMDISPVNQKRTCDIAVIQIKADDKSVVAKYATISEASRVCGINRAHISLVCRGKRETAGGFIWKYDYEENQEY